MTNPEIRAWYKRRISQIEFLDSIGAANGDSLFERARYAYSFRREARLEARSMMENPAEVEDLRERDRRLYGDPDGPSFEQLVAKYRDAALTQSEAYEKIIKGAQTTNRDVDESSE